jgi:hypothetical protein
MHAELNKVVAALEAFYSREKYLLDNDVGERALTHRLAVHVERQFDGWDVDCDYDRLGERTLLMPHGSIVSTEDRLSKSIFPDIVVHRRDVPNNLVAIELRKASNHQPIEHDQLKLKALTDPHIWFAYAVGVLLVLARKNIVHSEVYVAGAIDPLLTVWFAERLKQTGLAGG